MELHSCGHCTTDTLLLLLPYRIEEEEYKVTERHEENYIIPKEAQKICNDKREMKTLMEEGECI